MPDQPATLELGEAFKRIGQGERAAPVQQIEVDLIDLEPPQAALAGLDHAAVLA